MISPADWSRMSWHAREKYLRRVRMKHKQSKPHTTSQPPVEIVVMPSFRNDKIVSRCTSCGAWMIDDCTTNHGNRYEH